MKNKTVVVAIAGQNSPDTRSIPKQIFDMVAGVTGACAWATTERVKTFKHRHDPLPVPTDTYYGY